MERTLSAAAPPHSRVIAEDHRLSHSPGVEVFVRNKRPEGVERFPADRIVVLMHGATYPGNSFDLQIGGRSWMDELAGHGFDTYALDLPGYGRSTRPSVMNEPPSENPPFMRTADAVEVLAKVVDFVTQRRSVGSVDLIGWSWGTSITASYAAAFPEKVERLTLYAPLWIRTTPSLIPGDDTLGAYRVVTRESAEKRRRAGLSAEKALELMPKASFDAWADATFATDPDGRGQTLRAPNGVLLDTKEYWSAGRAAYDPARIACPTLIVVGEWDQDTPPYMAQTLFPLLVNAKWRRLTLIGEATHSLLLEKHRGLLFGTVRQFLEEPGPDRPA